MSKNFNPMRSLLFASAFFFCGILSAQFAGDLKFGIQISPTFSGMNTSDNLINRDGTNLGLKLGVLGEYYLSETYSVHTGLGFHFNTGGTLFYEDRFERVSIWEESLGGTLANVPDSIAGGLSYKYDLQFLEIPLGLTLRTREFGYIRYYVRPALHLGILTQARGSIKNAGFIDGSETFDLSKDVNSLNLSWSLGAGIEYSISDNTALIAGLAYQAGFADVTRDKGTTIVPAGRSPREDDSKGRVNVLVITLGIMF